MSTSTSRYLTLSQVAERLSTPVQTIRYWCSLGKLRAYKPGRHPLVRESDLDAFVEARPMGVVRAERAKRMRAVKRAARQ
jgi:excisionase family DNA binding protein